MRVGVDDEQSLTAQLLHRLVHLLGVDDRLIPVLLTSNEERRRGNVLHLHERRYAIPKVAVLPGGTEFRVEPLLIWIVTVGRGPQSDAGPADGARKTICGGDHVVRKRPSVGSTTDAEPIGVGVAQLHDVVGGNDHVLGIMGAPGAVVRECEVEPSASGASNVRHHHHAAVGGEELHYKIEAKIVLGPLAAVKPEEGRIAELRVEGLRLVDEGLDLGSVEGGEALLLRVGQCDRLQQLVVDVSETT